MNVLHIKCKKQMVKMLFITLFFVFASARACLPHPKPIYSLEEQDLKELFEEFIVKHAKAYDSHQEKTNRFQIFKQNVEKVNKRNSDLNETAIFDINHFADLTIEEFKQKYTGFRPSHTPGEYYTANEVFDVPDAFDWRDQQAVTPVKEEGGCGPSWAFSATGAVEGAYAIKHKHLISLSVRQLVDCDKYDDGCYGGLMQSAIQYLIEAGGQMREYDYPYTPDRTQYKCQFNKSKVAVKLTELLKYNLKGEEDTKKYLVANGPIAIGVTADDLMWYRGGIIRNCIDGTVVDQGVLLVGYKQEKGQNYYIIKNSWSADWGEQGYFRVEISGNPCQMYNSFAAGARVA